MSEKTVNIKIPEILSTWRMKVLVPIFSVMKSAFVVGCQRLRPAIKWTQRRMKALLIIFTVMTTVFVVGRIYLRGDNLSVDTDRTYSLLRLQNEQRKLSETAEESCHPKSHIVLLKTHKTESTIIQNILYRYGESKNLTFALPKNKELEFSYPKHFDTRFVEGAIIGRKFAFMCNDMRFKKSEVEKVMPEDSFYFSIMRHPVPMMQSVFTFYKGAMVFSGLHMLDDLILSSMEGYKSTDDNFDMTPNNLAFDFGYANRATADTPDLNDQAHMVISGIERDFNLILIHEYFDESLVLLRHALCWSMNDIVTMKRHSRRDQPRFPVLPETAEKILKWNALDWLIYKHFNATFWQKVESLVGIKAMEKEVSKLRELQAKLTNTCMTGKLYSNLESLPKSVLDGGEINLGFNINQDLDDKTKRWCHKLISPELQYTYNLYDRQFSEKIKL